MPEGKLMYVLAHCKQERYQHKNQKNYHKTKNQSKEPNNGEMTWEKPTTKNVDPLIEIINVKDKEIREKEEALVKLMSENEGITEENNKLKRCAKNMNQEIKLFVLNQSESEDMVVQNYCIV